MTGTQRLFVCCFLISWMFYYSKQQTIYIQYILYIYIYIYIYMCLCIYIYKMYPVHPYERSVNPVTLITQVFHCQNNKRDCPLCFPAEAVLHAATGVLIWSDVCEETRAQPCRDNQEPRPALFEDELNYLLWPDHYRPAGQTERSRPDLCDGAQEAITISF